MTRYYVRNDLVWSGCALILERVETTKCLSTHGGSGYAAGSYWDNGAIICGVCGYRIENPNPTGGRIEKEFVKTKGILGFLGFGQWVEKTIPRYGLLGEKPTSD